MSKVLLCLLTYLRNVGYRAYISTKLYATIKENYINFLMVALLYKTTRLSLGINTIERQIIYAALALREASSGIEAYTESIKIAGPSTPSDSTAPSLLTIGVILDCARNNAFHSYLGLAEKN